MKHGFLLISLAVILNNPATAQKWKIQEEKDSVYYPINLCFIENMDPILNQVYSNGQMYCSYSMDTVLNKSFFEKYYKNGSLASRNTVVKESSKRYFSEEEMNLSLNSYRTSFDNDQVPMDYTFDTRCSSLWETFHENGKLRSIVSRSVNGHETSNVYRKNGRIVYHAENSDNKKEGLISPRMENGKIKCVYYVNSKLKYFVYFSIRTNDLTLITDTNDTEVKSRKLIKEMRFYYEFLF